MNCRQTHELISAYLDQELTGWEMLEIGSHLRLCPACARECRETAEIRRLLRSLLPPAPTAQAERRLAERLARPEASAWTMLASALASPSSTTTVPRGRRLATALALSCVVILAVAAPFAPPAGDAAVSSGGMVTLPPLSLSPLSPPASWGTGAFPFLLHLPTPARTSPAPRAQAVAVDAESAIGTGEAEPLRDVTVTDYDQGNVALADYQASSAGAR